MSTNDFTPWSTLRGFFNPLPGWVPIEDQERLAAYAKYDELYWNDPRQFAIRVLEGEDPLYIPNARTVVDTTSHYLLKGLSISCEEKNTRLKEALDVFLKRERFYSVFHTAKHTGVARGDFVLHMTADPNKSGGSRISLNSVDPSQVFPIWHDDIPNKMIGCHIVDFYYLPDEPDKQRIRRLTYRLVEEGESRRVSREESIFEMEPKWYGPEPKLVQQVIPVGFLDDRIQHIPVYWFKNIDWDGFQYGSSELKGFESLIRAVTQGATDVQGALSLEGLGVYATDGGRPVDGQGNETDWEVAPGKVMEVPLGSYFRRVEGVGSITPATDQIEYIESKIREASGLSDVALGRVDVATAQSGIALAIKFMPTLAKIEERDTAGVEILTQLFFNWKVWHEVFEMESLQGDVIVEIGEKLPQNRTEIINELNNLLDRKIISKRFYRDKMTRLGYDFPDDLDKQIEDEARKEAELKALAAPLPLQQNAADAAAGVKPPPPQPNQSNNKNRTNESNGTEMPVAK
ncbi:MAG: hypothetical protein LC650_04235 [Actinobacteria bacterium]|nr:hypothetical protein [Actinomycetota bacterium]